MNYCYIEITLIYPFYFDNKNFFVILPRRNLNYHYHYHTMFIRFEMKHTSCPLTLLGVNPTISRHGIAQASLALLIWLDEMVVATHRSPRG